jgi:hypothetical protein
MSPLTSLRPCVVRTERQWTYDCGVGMRRQPVVCPRCFMTESIRHAKTLYNLQDAPQERDRVWKVQGLVERHDDATAKSLPAAPSGAVQFIPFSKGQPVPAEARSAD